MLFANRTPSPWAMDFSSYRGKQVRIFYVFRPGRRIVLLDAMIKKRLDIPRNVIERLRRLQKEVK